MAIMEEVYLYHAAHWSISKKGGVSVAICYDKLFKLLEEKGISTYYLRQNKIMGQQTYYNLKNGKGNLGTETLEKLCALLDCQPGDLMEYIPDTAE